MGRAAAALLMMLALIACTAVEPVQYKGSEPAFALQEYFSGELRAWGVFQGRGGDVRRRFTVDITGHMEGDELVLDERFRYADGERDQRVWRIERLAEHRYRGRAGDIVGTAEGRQYGFALNWRYQLNVPVDDKTWKLHFDDWMYRIDERTVVNRATVSKWGFTVGEVVLFFRKVSE